MKYSPISNDYSDSCATKEPEKTRYPTAHLDVPPAALKDLEAGEKVTITLVAEVSSLRFDTDDSWGTGASVGLSLRDIEIEGNSTTETQSVIDSMLD